MLKKMLEKQSRSSGTRMAKENMAEQDRLYVTRPFMPPIDEFIPYLEDIWQRKWLTNKGPYHEELEKALRDYLGVPHISLFANGTIALVTALQVLRITGEVITTPFSFVASSHALLWNGIKPVFCDIEPETFTLDPEKIEAAITPQTTAILPVHVYGYPCKNKQIKEIADSYGLKVIYDAAHAFGVTINGYSILNFGDLSVLSFHATKVFTTFEGGALVCHDNAMKKRIDFLKNFGFSNEVTVVGPGINGKLNEIQAAFGLLQLKYIDPVIRKRRRIACIYRERLSQIRGIRFMEDIKGVRHNYSYFPIIIEEKEYGRNRDDLYESLKKRNIYSRRYFYPLISQFPTYRGLPSASEGNLSTAVKISNSVLCLPIYPTLEDSDIAKVVEILS
jgi:dTDP-4-amino-4,6-dideoxygalactose transaminase